MTPIVSKTVKASNTYIILNNRPLELRNQSFSYRQTDKLNKYSSGTKFQLHAFLQHKKKNIGDYEEEFRDNLEFLQKRYKLCMNSDWTLSICRPICYFLDFSGKISPPIRFANYPYIHFLQSAKPREDKSLSSLG